jgi:zona occludens toxin (predicted ATPase)
MIVAFEGTPGSGKTYDAVREIINNLRTGRVVYTNVEGMDSPECQRFLQDHLGLDDYEFKKQFHYLPDTEMIHFFNLKLRDGALIVIDEIHKLFSSRNWRTENNQQFANWCSTHRHYGFDVYFVTQSLTKVESHVRSLVEWTYVYRKLNFLGGFSRNRYIKYAYSGDDTTGKPLNTISRLYEEKVFKCYKSFTNDTGAKLNLMPQVNVLKHPVFFIIPLVLAGFLYLLFTKSSFATGDIFGNSKVSKRLDSQQKPPVVAPSPTPPGQISSIQPEPFKSISSTVTTSGATVIGTVIADNTRLYLLSDGRSVQSTKLFRLHDLYIP